MIVFKIIGSKIRVHIDTENSKLENKEHGQVNLFKSILIEKLDGLQRYGRGVSSADEAMQNLNNSKLFAAIYHRKKTQSDKRDNIIKLLECGADINAQNSRKKTILHIAIEKDYKDIIKYLLSDAKIKLDIRNKDGRTALELAQSLKNTDIIQMLEEHIPGISPSIIPKKIKLEPLDQSSDIEHKYKVQEFASKQSSPEKRKFTSSTDVEDIGKKIKLEAEDNDFKPLMIPKADSTIFSQDNFHAKGGLVHSLHGNIYQLKLQMLFLKRATEQGYQFRLGTEVKTAETFDDLVFQYKKDDNSNIRFLQAKHKQDESKKITSYDLLKEKDEDFSLQKYFIAYNKIKKNNKFNSVKFQDFILCTNINFDFADLQKTQIGTEEIKEADYILDVTSGSAKSPARYKLIVDEHHEIYEQLKMTSDLHMLAKELAQHISQNKKVELRSDILKLYHGALNKEVLDIIPEEQKSDNTGKVTKRYAKFRPDFLHSKNLSEDAVNFRKALQVYLGKAEDEDAFKQELSGKKFAVSSKFGKVFELKSNPTITDPKRLAEDIVKRIIDHQNNIVTLNRANAAIKDNIDKLSGHILIQDQGDDAENLIRFRKVFFEDNTKLYGNLEEFKDAFKAALQAKNIDFGDISQYAYKISEFNTCEETPEGELLYSKNELPNDEIKDVEIKAFLGKLVFAVNQPNEVELGRIIAKEISASSQFNLLDADLVSDSFQREMLDWFKEKGQEKGKEGRFLGNKDAELFFGAIEQKVDNLVSIGLSLSYSEKLRAYGMNFNKGELYKSLKAFLSNDMSTTTKIFHLIAPEQTLFSAMKVYGIIEDLKQELLVQYQKHDSYTLLSLSKLLRPAIQKRALSAFQSEKSNNLLIIDCKSDAKENEISTLYQKLHDIFKTENKKIIVIAIKDNILASKFSSDPKLKFDTFKDNTSFIDLTEESKQRLLEKQVVFQGEKISLKELYFQLQDKELASPQQLNQLQIDSEALAQLITNVPLEIGSSAIEASDLERAYSELCEEVNMDTFVNKLSLQESGNIYIISGLGGTDKKNNLIRKITEYAKERSIINDIQSSIEVLNEQSINKRIQVADDQFGERDFKQICQNHPKKKIYWIHSENEGHMPKFKLQEIYNPHFHLEEQRFNNKVVINKSVKKQLASAELSEVFIISVKDKDEIENWFQFNAQDLMQFRNHCLDKKIQLLKGSDKSDDIFQSVINENQAQTVHALYFEQGELILSKTHGSLAKLIQHRSRGYNNSGDKFLIGEDDLIHEIQERKAVIISGDPGIGKSTTIGKLFKHNELAKSYWIIRVNLKDHLETIRGINFRNSNSYTEIITFLLQVDKELKGGIAKSLLNAALVNENFSKPLLIAFDGFDELLDEADRENTIQLLRSLNDETKAKFVITTRLYYVKILESKLSTFAINIEPMDDAIISRFITQYYYDHLDLTFSHDEFTKIFGNSGEVVKNKMVLKYTEAFISKMHKVFSNDATGFIGNPLQLYLMLEGSAGHFKEWVENENVQIPDFSYLGDDIWEIYKHFIDNKYNIAFKKAGNKAQIWHKVNKEFFDDHHKQIARYVIFQQGTEASWKGKTDVLLSAGILKSHGSAIEFIHPTFAEYFATELLIDEIKKDTNKPPNLLQEILLKPNYKIIRTFFNSKLLKERIQNIRLVYEDLIKNEVLFVAVDEENIGITSFLLDNLQDININCLDTDGMTVLHIATEYGNLKLARLLVERGADVNAKANSGITVLHFAAQSGNLELVRWLVEEDRHVNWHRHDSGNDKITIRKTIDVNARNEVGATALHTAAAFGYLDIVKFLVEKGADVNAQDQYGMEAKHLAAESKHLEIVQFLVGVEEGSNNTKDENTLTVLDLFLSFGYLDIVKSLVVKQPTVMDAKNKSGSTVLHFAARSGNLELVKWLVEEDRHVNWHRHDSGNDKITISKIIDVNAIDEIGATALHTAAEYGHLNIVKFLVEKGANVNAKDKYSCTVLHFAARSGNLELVKWLVEEDRHVNWHRHDSGNDKITIRKTIDVNARNEVGATALHTAAEYGHLNIVKFLVEKGADVNAQDQYGMTVLDYAHRKEHNYAVVKFLNEQIAHANNDRNDAVAVDRTRQEKHSDAIDSNDQHEQVLDIDALQDLQQQQEQIGLEVVKDSNINCRYRAKRHIGSCQEKEDEHLLPYQPLEEYSAASKSQATKLYSQAAIATILKYHDKFGDDVSQRLQDIISYNRHIGDIITEQSINHSKREQKILSNHYLKAQQFLDFYPSDTIFQHYKATPDSKDKSWLFDNGHYSIMTFKEGNRYKLYSQDFNYREQCQTSEALTFEALEGFIKAFFKWRSGDSTYQVFTLSDNIPIALIDDLKQASFWNAEQIAPDSVVLSKEHWNLIESIPATVVKELFLVNGRTPDINALHSNFFKHAKSDKISFRIELLHKILPALSSDQIENLFAVIKNYNINYNRTYLDHLSLDERSLLEIYYDKVMNTLKTEKSLSIDDLSSLSWSSFSEGLAKHPDISSDLANEIVSANKEIHSTTSKGIILKGIATQTLFFLPDIIRAANSGDLSNLEQTGAMIAGDTAINHLYSAFVDKLAPVLAPAKVELLNKLPVTSPIFKAFTIYSIVDLHKQLPKLPPDSAERSIIKHKLGEQYVTAGLIVAELLGFEVTPLWIGLIVEQLIFDAESFRKQNHLDISFWEAFAMSLGFERDKLKEIFEERQLVEMKLALVNQINNNTQIPYGVTIVKIPKLEEIQWKNIALSQVPNDIRNKIHNMNAKCSSVVPNELIGADDGFRLICLPAPKFPHPIPMIKSKNRLFHYQWEQAIYDAASYKANIRFAVYDNQHQISEAKDNFFLDQGLDKNSNWHRVPKKNEEKASPVARNNKGLAAVYRNDQAASNKLAQSNFYVYFDPREGDLELEFTREGLQMLLLNKNNITVAANCMLTVQVGHIAYPAPIPLLASKGKFTLIDDSRSITSHYVIRDDIEYIIEDFTSATIISFASNSLQQTKHSTIHSEFNKIITGRPGSIMLAEDKKYLQLILNNQVVHGNLRLSAKHVDLLEAQGGLSKNSTIELTHVVASFNVTMRGNIIVKDSVTSLQLNGLTPNDLPAIIYSKSPRYQAVSFYSLQLGDLCQTLSTLLRLDNIEFDGVEIIFMNKQSEYRWINRLLPQHNILHISGSVDGHSAFLTIQDSVDTLKIKMLDQVKQDLHTEIIHHNASAVLDSDLILIKAFKGNNTESDVHYSLVVNIADATHTKMFNSKYYDHGGILVFRDTTNQLFYHCFPISDRIRLNNIDYLLSNQRICAVAEGQDVIDGNHLIRYSSIVSNLSEISKMIGVCFPESLSTSSIAIQNSSLVINGVMLKNIDESIKLYFGDKEIFKAKILLDSHVGSQSALVTDSNFLINHRLASFDPDLLGGIRYIISAINSKNGIISHCKVPIDQKSEILAVHYNQERLKQLVHDNKSTEILIWLIVKDYQNLSLLNTSMSHKKLAQEISKCYMFIDSIVIHRLLRHLPSDDILTRVDKFIKHHHAALESKIIESLFSIQSDTQRVQRSVDDIIVSSTTTMCSDELEEVSSKNSSRSDTNNLSDEILQGNKEIFGEVIDDVNHY